MELNDVQRAGLSRALDTLDSNPEYEHKMAVIRRFAGPEVVAEIMALKAEYKDANKSAQSMGAGMLSADAAEYWQEATGVLAYGRLVHHQGLCTKSLSRKCEALDESFPHRVPDREKGMFAVHELDGGNWDDRWHACQDYNFPILRAGLINMAPVQHPMNAAQQAVLRALVRPVADQGVISDALARQAAMLMALAKGQTVRLVKSSKQAKAADARAKLKAKKKRIADQTRDAGVLVRLDDS